MVVYEMLNVWIRLPKVSMSRSVYKFSEFHYLESSEFLTEIRKGKYGWLHKKEL